MREGQALCSAVARVAVLHFLARPAQEQRTLLVEEPLQVGRVKTLVQQGFTLTDDVEVHQREVDFMQAEFLAHQPAVHFDLGPMQLPMVGGLGVEVAAIGFHLFEAVAVRVIAVRPAPHPELLEFAFQGHFVLIMRTASRGDRAMADDTFLGAGRRREAQVEVADLGRELTQRPHRNAVAQAGSAQRT
jgi:hypothetical protein